MVKWLCMVTMLLLCSVVHSQVTYVYTDPQGTPLAEADTTGHITATFDYRPYGGIALGTAPNGPGYTGHVNDPDVGLVYMQARYYDPAVGRFVSTDPVGPDQANIFNFNRFTYTNNNPINHIDPDGRQLAPGDDGAYAMSARYGTTISSEAANQGAKLGLTSVPIVGDAINIHDAIQNPTALNITVAAIGVVPVIGTEAASALKASAAVRAVSVAGTMSARTQRAVTIAVTETKEGVRVVSSSEGKLRPAARAALQTGEVAGKGVKGAHAEVNGINAAKEMGLTPTGTAASRPICPSCAQTMQASGVDPLSPVK